MEGYVQGLIARKELFDLVYVCEGDRSGEQAFAFSNVASEDRFVHVAQGELCVVAGDLRVKQWIAIDEIDCEAELVGVEDTMPECRQQIVARRLRSEWGVALSA